MEEAWSFSRPQEVIDGAIVRAFDIRREKASGKLVLVTMIQKAFATKPLPGTRVVTTIAVYNILFLINNICF